MKLSPRRAENLSLVALLLGLVCFVLTLWLAKWSNSLAAQIEAWHFLGGSTIWLALFMQFRQRRLADEERLDAEAYQKLRRQGKNTSVFEGTPVEDSLHLAERRLVWLEKYLVPIFAILTAVYMLAVSVWLFGKVKADEVTALAGHGVILQSSVFLIAMGLLSFLFSRYASGMSRQDVWRPIRAGGNYLIGNAILCVVIAVGLVLADFRYSSIDRIVAYVLVVIMFVLGVEIVLNFTFDFFRPRIKGQYHRAAFESRLLGLFCEPEGLLKTAAHAMDYQFGFKVSETWFYKLLERAVVPLLAVMVIALWLVSCTVIIPPGHEGIMERWGEPINLSSPLQSGMHLKYPWPVDKVRMFAVEQIQVIEVGFERFEDEGMNRPVLWTVSHWKNEFPFVVASQRQSSMDKDTAGEGQIKGNFDLLVVALVVHYRISDVAKYGYSAELGYQDPAKLLKALCYRQAVQYAAQSDVQSLMGPGREATTQQLKVEIQSHADKYQMGVKIEFVGLESVHPPVEVAESFEKVVSALQEKQASVLGAQGEDSRIREEAAGASSVMISEAEAYSVERASLSRASAERFGSQVEAYKLAKDIYLWREYLAVLDEYMPALRKYVLASDKVGSWVYEIDLKEELQPDLFEDLGLTED